MNANLRALSLGRRGSLVWLAFGAAAVALTWHSGPSGWGALIASWLFFAGTAAGLVALQAALDLSGARWAPKTAMDELSKAALGVWPAAGALLVAILAGAGQWSAFAHGGRSSAAFWYAAPSLWAREIVVSGALYALARAYLKRRSSGFSGGYAVGYSLGYAFALTVWALDFILGADRRWMSTLIGPHLFMGALLAAVALLSFFGALSERMTAQARHDAGKLLFGLCAFWAYLAWSQYLPIWYGNLPDEVEFVILRSARPWSALTLVVIALCFAIPFALLFHERGKRAPRVLLGAALSVLFGLWLERVLLVAPSLSPRGLNAGAAVTALAVAGAFVNNVRCAVPRRARQSPRHLRTS